MRYGKKNKWYLRKLLSFGDEKDVQWLNTRTGWGSTFHDTKFVITSLESYKVSKICKELEIILYEKYKKPLFEEVEL